jgi:hypothetical protein
VVIYISLENDRIKISDRRRIDCSLRLMIPLVLQINKTVNWLGRERNVSCNVSVKIADTINLEVRNER